MEAAAVAAEGLDRPRGLRKAGKRVRPFSTLVKSTALCKRSQKPDYSFRLATRDGIYTYYDELDESTEPVASTWQRESLEAKIRFHEDYQSTAGRRPVLFVVRHQKA